MANGALRKKLEGARVARPPVADIARLANQYARLLEDGLRMVLGSRPEIQVLNASSQTRGAAHDDVADDGYLASVSIDGAFAGGAVLTAPFAFSLIEMMTGVAGAPPPDAASPVAPPRALTAIDKALLQAPGSAIFVAFTDALRVSSADPLCTTFQHPVIAGASEISEDEYAVEGLAIVLSVTLVNGAAVFELPVFIPFSTLDCLDNTPPAPSAGQTAAPSVWSRTMLTAARNAPFRMVGVLHEKQMSVGDIKDMKVGSVISLPADHRMQIDLRIDTPRGVSREPTVGGGVLGVADGQRAVRLTAPADADFLAYLEVLRA